MKWFTVGDETGTVGTFVMTSGILDTNELDMDFRLNRRLTEATLID